MEYKQDVSSLNLNFNFQDCTGQTPEEEKESQNTYPPGRSSSQITFIMSSPPSPLSYSLSCLSCYTFALSGGSKYSKNLVLWRISYCDSIYLQQNVQISALFLDPIFQFNRGKLFQFSASDWPETAFHQTEPNRLVVMNVSKLTPSTTCSTWSPSPRRSWSIAGCRHRRSAASPMRQRHSAASPTRRQPIQSCARL